MVKGLENKMTVLSQQTNKISLNSSLWICSFSLSRGRSPLIIIYFENHIYHIESFEIICFSGQSVVNIVNELPLVVFGNHYNSSDVED